jgi:N-acyl homoserine lactone hydrolase
MEKQWLLKGSPIALTVLDFGLFTVHSNGRIIGLPGLLIETDEDERILIDTGFPMRYADDIEKASADDNLGEFGRLLKLTHENMPAGQLALKNLKVEDIDLLVITHTHIDHVGNIDAFPGVPIIIGAGERALSKPIYWRGKQPMEWPDEEYILIDNDREIGAGIEILHVPGHTPGELSIMVNLPESGWVLLTGDAISRPSEIEEGFLDAFNPAQALEQANRILDLASQRNALVIYGHGPEQWATLKKAPDSYL